MRLLKILFVIVLLAISAMAQEAPANNWSQFRGNQRNTGVSESKIPADLKVLWTFEAGDSIESSAAIVGGTVFVGTQKGELVALSLDGPLQIELSLLNIYQLDFGAGKIAVRGGEFHVFQLRVQQYVGDRLIHDHRMVDATVERALFYPDPAGRVCLWVHVYKQRRNVGGRKTGGEIDGRSRLPNPTFLIGDCNDFSHMSISRRDELKVRQRRATYHIRNSSESKWRRSTWNGGN